MENLTANSFFAYALQSYNNPSCSGMAEFEEDLTRIKYIKRLLHKYVRGVDIPSRLLLNHIIGVCNVFRTDAIARMLFLRIDEDAWPALKTVLSYLNVMPDVISPINGKVLTSASIQTDEVLLEMLRVTVEGNISRGNGA